MDRFDTDLALLCCNILLDTGLERLSALVLPVRVYLVTNSSAQQQLVQHVKTHHHKGLLFVISQFQQLWNSNKLSPKPNFLSLFFSLSNPINIFYLHTLELQNFRGKKKRKKQVKAQQYNTQSFLIQPSLIWAFLPGTCYKLHYGLYYGLYQCKW